MFCRIMLPVANITFIIVSTRKMYTELGPELEYHCRGNNKRRPFITVFNSSTLSDNATCQNYVAKRYQHASAQVIAQQEIAK